MRGVSVLAQLGVGVRVPQRFEKAAVHSPRVAAHQLRLRDVGLVGRFPF
jgi:hypothetical protein